MVLGKLECNMKLEAYLSLSAQTKPQLVKNLNIRPNTLKLLDKM